MEIEIFGGGGLSAVGLRVWIDRRVVGASALSVSYLVVENG